MDEIFDRIKAIKIKRKYLVISLVATELIGIFILILFLRVPLSQKFLTLEQKSYNADKMLYKKRYKVNQNDFLVGTASGSAKLKFYLSPNKAISEQNIDHEGKWSYHIPQELNPGKYSLYIAKFDSSNKVRAIKSYKLTVKSNNILLNLRQNVFKRLISAAQGFPPRLVSAQDEEGINPLLETEIVLTPEEDVEIETAAPETLEETPSYPDNADPQCSEEEWEENTSCNNMVCGEVIQFCPKTGETRIAENHDGSILCSDPYVNAVCSEESTEDEVTELSFLKFNASPALSNDTSYDMGVLVIKYFPLTADRTRLDFNIVKESRTYEQIKRRTEEITENLKSSIEKASTYLGYANPDSQPALRYNIIDSLEYTSEPPRKSEPQKPNHLDYNQVMIEHNICDYIDNKGVREVWIFAYQNENLGIWENIASIPNFRDVNDNITANEMPECSKSYVVYTLNYIGGTASALESWGHQFENEIRTLDSEFFNNRFQGPPHPQKTKQTGRCGSVHNPPNARREYDHSNLITHPSDCLDWNPDNLGQASEISCLNWSPNGCRELSDTDNPYINYQIWNWQNLPGRNNNKTYQGKQIRNLWDIHGDFDNVIRNNRTIFLGDQPTLNNPYNVFCSGIYNLKPQQTDISGRTVHVNAGQSVSLKIALVNDINDEQATVWYSSGGSFRTTRRDLAEYIVPKEEGEYQVWVTIYGEEQFNCKTTFTVGRLFDEPGEPN